MFSKNRNILMLILCLVLLIFPVVYESYVFNQFNKENEVMVADLNKKIDDLKTSNTNNTAYIERIKKQISAYEIENDRLKDMVNSQKKEAEHVSAKVKVTTAKYKQSDLKLLAQLIQSESGNQSFEGKLAVGTVVMNRVESDKFPDTIRAVIYQKHQFSVVSDGSINNKPSEESLKAAKKIMEGSRVLESDVLYFYNPDITNDRWIKRLKVDKTIGDHVFA
jgi:spore germination cell wall hydrolase CwlJ-like protein